MNYVTKNILIHYRIIILEIILEYNNNWTILILNFNVIKGFFCVFLYSRIFFYKVWINSQVWGITRCLNLLLWLIKSKHFIFTITNRTINKCIRKFKTLYSQLCSFYLPDPLEFHCCIAEKLIVLSKSFLIFLKKI